jgi:peptidoglycan/xylan/chitin deacetylase (PgdA/CDA1 family)
MTTAHVTQILKHFVATKGVFRAAERSGQIVARFAFGRRRFEAMIESLQRDIAFPSVKITFCVTASVLGQHADLIRRLQTLGHEFAAHGYFHTDVAKKARVEQDEILSRSYRAFQDSELPVFGFRCPYLSYNQDTLDALNASPFVYTSHDVVLWEDTIASGGQDADFLRRLWDLYHIIPAEHMPIRPRMIDRLVEIPLTGPDDEMLFERSRVRAPEALVEVWSEVLDRCHARGELYHLLFHPERFPYLERAISQLILKARTQPEPVWFCSLRELAQWWKERDRARWAVESDPSGECRAWIRVPAGGTVIRQQHGVTTPRPVYRDDVEALPIARRGESLAFAAGGSRRELIGLSPRCDRRVADFLTEEGFPVERSEQPDLYSFYLDGYGTFRDNERVSLLEQIEKCPHPILRLWRWPFQARSAFTISSDVDSISLGDFVQRAIHF